MKTHQTFRIDEDLRKKALKMAEKENRKIGNLYETAIRVYVEKKSHAKQ